MLNLLLDLTPYERGYKLGQGVGVLLVILVIAYFYFRKKKKDKNNDSLLDK